MYIKLSKNSFVRHINDMGYIINQLSRKDMFLNDIGADFMSEISREPVLFDHALTNLSNLYGDSVSFDELKTDFSSFIEMMVRDGFYVCADTIPGLDENDHEFSYEKCNLQSFVNNFSEYSNSLSFQDSMETMREASKSNPRLNGLQFELTSRCNERCIHCYIPNGKKDRGKDMPTEKVFSIIEEFSKMGGLSVTLSGGELFLHKDIIPIIEFCREKDLQINILSNLIALKDEHIPHLKKANIAVIQVSLYSMEPEIHDAITKVKGSHKLTISAIERLVKADIPVQIACPIMKTNMHGYKDVLLYSQKIKCRAQCDFIMMARSDFSTDNLNQRLSLEETEQIINDILSYDVDYKQWMKLPKDVVNKVLENRDRYAKDSLCGAGRNDLCITDNGDVYPCAGWQGMVVGNVYSETLFDIWHNSEKLKIVRSVKQSDFPQCLNCKVRDYCSPCLMRNFNENNGDMYKVAKHFCNVAALNKRLVDEYLLAMEEGENPLKSSHN